MHIIRSTAPQHGEDLAASITQSVISQLKRRLADPIRQESATALSVGPHLVNLAPLQHEIAVLPGRPSQHIEAVVADFVDAVTDLLTRPVEVGGWPSAAQSLRIVARPAEYQRTPGPPDELASRPLSTRLRSNLVLESRYGTTRLRDAHLKAWAVSSGVSTCEVWSSAIANCARDKLLVAPISVAAAGDLLTVVGRTDVTWLLDQPRSLMSIVGSPNVPHRLQDRPYGVVVGVLDRHCLVVVQTPAFRASDQRVAVANRGVRAMIDRWPESSDAFLRHETYFVGMSTTALFTLRPEN